MIYYVRKRGLLHKLSPEVKQKKDVKDNNDIKCNGNRFCMVVYKRCG